MSRALGDFVYKQRPDLKPEQQQVSAEPEIKVERRSADDQVRKRNRRGARACRALLAYLLHPAHCLTASPPHISCEQLSLRLQLLVLACDGIWDVMSNPEVAEFLMARPMASQDDLKKAAEALLEECLTRGSRDNMSVVLAGFAGARLRGAAGAIAHPAHEAGAAAGGAAIGGAGSAAGPAAGSAPAAAAAGPTEGL